jgi:transposase
VVRFAHVIDARLRGIKAATALTTDEAVIGAYRLQVEVLVEQLRTTLRAIERFDRQIAKLAPTLPDYDLFSALPGAGPHLAPRLLAAFGEQRERFRCAEELQRYAGVAPVTERSGKKSWVHWRWQCPTFLRQTFVEWAAQTVNKSFWAGAFYRQHRDSGSTLQTAVRRWLTNGYGSCTAAGRPARPTTKLPTLRRCENEAPRSSNLQNISPTRY